MCADLFVEQKRTTCIYKGRIVLFLPRSELLSLNFACQEGEEHVKYMSIQNGGTVFVCECIGRRDTRNLHTGGGVRGG